MKRERVYTVHNVYGDILGCYLSHADAIRRVMMYGTILIREDIGKKTVCFLTNNATYRILW